MGNVVNTATIIFDVNDMFVDCDQLYADLFPSAVHLLKKGTKLDELLLWLRHQAFVATGSSCDEIQIKQLVDELRRPFFEFEEELSDGRKLLIRSKRLSSGLLIIQSSDVSRLQKSGIETRSVELLNSGFWVNMNRDISTPLNGIIGMTQMLLSTDLPPMQRAYLEIVKRSGFTLKTVTDNLFDLSMLGSGQLRL